MSVLTDGERQDRTEFFNKIRTRLKHAGFGIKHIVDSKDWDGGRLYKDVAKWSRKIPPVQVWAGASFGRQDTVWVGFGSTESKVSILRECAENAGIISTDNKFIEFREDLKVNLLTINNGIICEYDIKKYYIGIYFLDLADDVVERAVRFLTALVESVQTLEEIDIAKIDASDLSHTEKEMLILARRGQGKFRRDVENAWQGRCAVTSCAVPQILRASHIKPWHKSDNIERLDRHNGLLLSAHIDALFDKRLISFKDDGAIVISACISADDRRRLSLNGMTLVRRPSPQQASYLKDHRETLL